MIKIDDFKKLNIQNGDVVVIDKKLTPQQLKELRFEWNRIGLDKCLLIHGMDKEDIMVLDEERMKEYGWIKSNEVKE